jgi:hypothetical protein
MPQGTAIASFVVVVIALVILAAIVENALGEDDPLVYVPVGVVGGLAIGLAYKHLVGGRA